MKIYIFIGILLGASFLSNSQPILPTDKKQLLQQQEKLKVLSTQIITGRDVADKFSADSLFTRGFVQALKTPNSFYFPFDSLVISKLYAPDSSFRIFTWQMEISENSVRQHGAIQMRTKDGSLKLLPLIDKSDIIENLTDTITNNLAWMGAVYYKIIKKTWQNKAYYTLLGFDQNNIRSTKKVIEILTFENGEPIFGNRNFVLEKGNTKGRNMARYIIEYKKDANPKLNYDADLDMIVMEHLISESNQPTKKWTLIPDGDYEGFKWVNGYWAYISKIFNEVTPEGKPPTPKIIRDEKGNLINQ